MRGLTPLKLSVSKLWHSGPEWLKHDICLEDNEAIPMPEECAAELKPRTQKTTTHNLIASEQPTELGTLVKCENYSWMTHLLRVTTYLFQAVKAFKKPRNPNTPPDSWCVLTMEQLLKAEKLWVAQAQFSLTKYKSFNLWKQQFGLFLGATGLWRCGGRLGNAIWFVSGWDRLVAVWWETGERKTFVHCMWSTCCYSQGATQSLLWL